MHFAVASINPVKINAVQLAVDMVFPFGGYHVTGHDVSFLNLPVQPRSDAETEACMRARLEELRKNTDADFFVAIEAGVRTRQHNLEDDTMDLMSWIGVCDKKGHESVSQTASLRLPPQLKRMVDNGLELGVAVDKAYNTNNNKQRSGVIGLLTHGVIDRTQYYIQPLVFALAPWRNEALYWG